MWSFIVPNQRQQTATRMHAFHIPHWRMNKWTCLFHLDQQRHVKKKLDTSQEVRSWRQGSFFHQFFGSKLSCLEKSRRQYWNTKNSCRTPWIKIQELGKAVLICELETNIGPTEPYPHHQWWIHGMPPLVRANLWPPGPVRRHGELLALKNLTEGNLWKPIWNSEINGFCTLLVCNWTWSGDQQRLNGKVIVSEFQSMDLFWRASAIWRYVVMYPWAWNIRWHAGQNAGKNLRWFHKLTATSGNYEMMQNQAWPVYAKPVRING